jgi:hypothetical protein
MNIISLYREVVSAYAKPYNPEQCEAWQRVLGHLSEPDARAAVAGWQRKVEPDYDGRPLGSKMPTPADILAVHVARKRAEQAVAQRRFVGCEKCSHGWLHVTITSKLTGKNESAVKRCVCWLQYIDAMKKAA